MQYMLPSVTALNKLFVQRKNIYQYVYHFAASLIAIDNYSVPFEH